jgi:flavin reductase (DIM6/NTAB) family NADH-FMN oxidoreductase RutF
MALYSLPEIQSWERFFRANFINSLSGFKSVNLIGTVNGSGQTNLALFSSVIHIGSNPPLIGFINRPLQAATHTLANIKATGFYTINQIHPSFLKQAHQTSAKYPGNISEFDETGLTPQFIENIPAPFVKESHVKYALSLAEIIPITLNDTFLVIGNVLWVIAEDDILSKDGFLQLDQSQTVCSNGNDAYYTTTLLNRYQYAKPGVNIEEIN